VSKDLDLTSLRLFVQVCDTGSIKQVAERERVDASAVTKRLAKLEEALQTPLLKRVRQGVQATPEGTLLSELARRLVLDARKISDAFAGGKQPLQGHVLIASHMASMSSVLTDDLASFLKRNNTDGVRLKVREMLSKDVVHMVRDGEAQVGVIWDNTETSGLQHVPYYNDTIVALVGQDHPLRQRHEVSIAEVIQHELIANPHMLHTGALLKRSLGGGFEDLRCLVEVDNNQSALRLAAHGVGVFVSQDSIYKAADPSLKLVSIALTDAWARIRVKLIFQSSLQQPLALHLIDHLSQQHRHALAQPVPLSVSANPVA
jgi:DNA-binding transcriptional LysR family regulator